MINKIKKISLVSGFLASSIAGLNAMEFGSMGNVSASMGGAGVALKSPFGLYYNPALIASERKFRFAYSLSAGIDQNNLDKLSNIKFDEMIKTLSSVGSSLGGTSQGGGNAGGGNQGGGGNAGGGNTGNANVTSVKDALTEALQQTVTGQGNNNDLESLWKAYQQQQNGSTDNSKLAENLQTSINNSGMSQSEKDMFNGLADSIDWSNFDVSNGQISSMTIKKGNNAALDEAMGNLDTLFFVLKNNNMNVRSQNGIVFQIPSEVINEEYGALAIGLFNTTQAGVSLVGDPNRMRLIFGSDGSYYELQVGENGYTIKTATQDDYNKYSLVASIESGDAHKITSSIFALTELPIGYAYNMNFGVFNLSLGAAFKIMNGASLFNETYLGKSLNFNMDFNNSTQFSTTFGIDVGAYFGYNVNESNQLSLGFVAKNVNSPTFRFNSAPTIVIDPQYRVGFAYNGKYLAFAFDADILPNKVLNYSYGNKLSQMVGGGVKVDFRYIDVRAGLAYDLKQDSGVILTAGFNFFGFIDIAAEVGTKWVDYFGHTAPKYANVRLGGSFSF